MKHTSLLFALATVVVTSVAFAQAPEVQVAQLNQQAMTAYGNLDIDTAMATLQQAEAVCQQNGIGGTPLARTYMNMGIVVYGGLGDNAAAMEHFKKALCIDANIKLDPLNSTPDMEILFKGAAAQVQAQGCAGVAAPPAGAAAAPAPVAPATAPQPAANDVLRHTTVVQQKRMHPIPFYVETNPNLEVGQVILYYKTTGESIYQQVPLAKKGTNGWGGYVDCEVLSTLDPSSIDYYIAVLDPNGQILSTAGTEAQPFQIAISDAAPALPAAIPGEEPLPACQAECPPWEPNCNQTNCGQYSDLCSEAEPCCEGLVCIDGVCDEGEGGGGEDDDWVEGKPKTVKSKVRIFLNGGTGLGLVPGDTYTSDDFPNKITDLNVKAGFTAAWSKIHIRAGVLFQLPVEALQVGVGTRLDLPLSPDYPAVFPSVMAIAAYALTAANPQKGLEARATLGLGWMNIAHRIKFKDCNPTIDGTCPANWHDPSVNEIREVNGFRKSGAFGAELGLTLVYWTGDKFGVQLPSLNAAVVFPRFAVNFDVQAGVQLRF